MMPSIATQASSGRKSEICGFEDAMWNRRTCSLLQRKPTHRQADRYTAPESSTSGVVSCPHDSLDHAAMKAGLTDIASQDAFLARYLQNPSAVVRRLAMKTARDVSNVEVEASRLQ
jgi:hypothetical protein